MRSREARVLESLRRAQDFLDDHGNVLQVVNQSGARKTLDDVVVQLTAHAVTQDGGRRIARGEGANQRMLRLALRFNHMKPIAEVAKLRLRDVPNFKALTLPPSDAKGARLVAAAGAMADAATPFAQTFVDEGLPADFIAQLKAAADAVSLSIDERAQNRVRRSGATMGLAAEGKRGTGVLKLLDALVIPKLGTDDRLIAEWKAARSIHRKPGVVIGTVAAARTGAHSESRVQSPESRGTASNSTSTTPAPQPAAQAA